MRDDAYAKQHPADLAQLLADNITAISIAGLSAGEKPTAKFTIEIPIGGPNVLLEHWLGLALGTATRGR